MEIHECSTWKYKEGLCYKCLSCKRKRTIRSGSKFQFPRGLSPVHIVIVLIESYILKLNAAGIQQRLQIYDGTQISQQTLQQMLKGHRRKISHLIQVREMNEEPLDEPVQIDETMWSHKDQSHYRDPLPRAVSRIRR